MLQRSKPKVKKIEDKYYWTEHVLFKLRQYSLSQSRVRRIIRRPDRVQEGIAYNTVAVMQKTGSSKNPTELWAMYQFKKGKKKNVSEEQKQFEENFEKFFGKGKHICIISTWRYPGISPKEDPIPEEVFAEIQRFIGR